MTDRRQMSGPLYAVGELLTVTGMPNYGAIPVTGVKWSSVSGWWYDLRDGYDGTWSIPETAIEGRAT